MGACSSPQSLAPCHKALCTTKPWAQPSPSLRTFSSWEPPTSHVAPEQEGGTES